MQHNFGGDPLCYYLSQSLGNSSNIRMIMFIVSCLKKLSLVRDVVQQDFVFNQWGASSMLQIVLAPRNPPCLCSHRGCRDEGICQWGNQGINPTLWETLVLGARIVLNIVPGVTGKRKYAASSKMTSAVSELFLPISLFQSLLLLGVHRN